VDPLFRQGHASQVFELARILSDQVIPPDRISTFVGLLIAGIFTFVPDRLMYRVFFGS
jgi:hypothetical protein